MLVAANKQLYITLPKRQKMLLSRSIVNAVRSQNPPGRFLQKDSKTKSWSDVGDQKAQEKTSQALREGAPDIRKKVANQVTSSTDDVTTEVKGTDDAVATNPSTSSSTTEQPTTTTTATSLLAPEGATSSGMGGRMMPPPPQQQQQQYVGTASSSSTSNNGYVQQQQRQSNNMYGSVPATTNNNNTNNGIYSGMVGGGRRTGMNNNFQQPHPVQQQQLQQNNNNNSYQHHQYQQQQQQQHHHNQQQQQQYYNSGNSNNNGTTDPTPTFDDFVAAPPEELDTQGISFGSIAMTDSEMNRLQQASAMGSNRQSHQQQQQQQGRYSLSQNNNNYHDNNPVALPTSNTLEPTGISMGDVSMMSAGTNFQMKLEDIGTSFGTMMSYNTSHPDMVDGGLMEAVGTSFGSLSLDMNGGNNNDYNRDKLYRTLEIAAGGAEVPPMFSHAEQKSSGNLLDCDDTDSENSDDKDKLVAQKSQAWEMMQTKLIQQTSKGNSVGSQDLMPPPPGKSTFENIEVALPTSTLESNFSTLSAWSAADDDGNDFTVSNSHPGATVKGEDE